jgi:aspartate/methionine/tyrosine aminotransferase
MDQAKAEAISTGKTIIDLFLGSSDLQALDAAIAAIEKSLRDPTTHSYLLRHGTGHWTLTLLNPQKIALLPNPGYPFSAGSVHLTGGQFYTIPLPCWQKTNFYLL